MAKNKDYSQIHQYANRQEEIRKAKGNPNKNNHVKKKNSNYGGYTAGRYKAAQQERVKLPMWLNITLGALFAAVLTRLILRMTVLKDSMPLNYLSALPLGVTCLVLFYIRRFRHTKKGGALYTVVTFLLSVMGVVYTGMGIIGLLTIAGII